MASLANKDDAEKCRDMANKFLARGERDKAIRFFEKSLRLYPLPGVEAMMGLAKADVPNGEASTSQQARPTSAPFSANANGYPASNDNGGSNNSRSSSGRNGGAGGTPGMRRRPASTAAGGGGSRASNGSSPAGGAGGAGGGAGGGSGRAYTEEQEQAVKKIIDSKTNGHYAVLGVAKDATEDQIKRAYRKLALRFHPDKNGAPHAHEAFQAIGTAFAVLSDGEKRAHYNRFGDDDGPQGIGGGGHGPFAAHGGYRAGEVSPEDIFNMFFGGMPAGGGGDVRRRGAGPFRVYRTGGGVRRGEGGGQQQGGSAMNLLALLPFIMLLLLSLFGGQQEDIFTFRQSSKYNIERVTAPNLGVVEGIHYYVAPGFWQQYGGTREKLRRVEAQVTQTYRSYLRSECLDLQARRDQNKMKLRYRRARLTREAYEQKVAEVEAMPMPACDELVSRFNIYSKHALSTAGTTGIGSPARLTRKCADRGTKTEWKVSPHGNSEKRTKKCPGDNSQICGGKLTVFSW